MYFIVIHSISKKRAEYSIKNFEIHVKNIQNNSFEILSMYVEIIGKDYHL